MSNKQSIALTKYERLTKELGRQIENEMNNRQLDQIKMAEMLEQSQSTISNMINGKTNVSMKTYFAALESLNLDPLEKISALSQAENPKSTSPARSTFIPLADDPFENFIVDPEDRAFHGYTGKFHIYFLSTNRRSSNLLHGILHLRRIKGYCAADLELIFDPQKEHKVYGGFACLSVLQKSLYLLLINNEIQEMCFLALPYDPILTLDNSLQCSMAMAVTISSGIDSRVPTAHRVFFSRKKLDPDQETSIRSQLLLNKSTIRIPAGKFQELRENKAFSKEFIQCFNQHCHEIIIYEIDEDYFKELEQKDPNRFKEICLLRSYSDSPKNNKVNPSVISKIYHEIINRS